MSTFPNGADYAVTSSAKSRDLSVLTHFVVNSYSTKRVYLRCHYEVVAVEAADFVSPESNCYTAPFGQNRGMMALLFGQSANAIG